MTGARKPSRKQKHNWPVNDEVQAILAVWLVAVAGVHPVEEEGVNGGSAGGAFAWREAESSGKARRWFSRAVRETESWSS